MPLRDYQKRDVERIRAAMRDGARAPLYVLPTGGGKTAVFTHIAEQVQSNGRRAVVLAHRKELVEQASSRLCGMDVDHGVIAPWAPKRYDRGIQVASVASLVRRLEHVPEPDLLIVDEAHHAPAGSWQTVREAWPRARVLGVTATPCRLDGRPLSGAFDELIVGPSVRELVDDGYLVPSDVYAPSAPDLSGVRTRGGDFDSRALDQIIEQSQIVGDAVRSYRRYAAGRTAVAFCASVKHATATAQAFDDAGIPAAVLTGNTPTDKREKILSDLATGALKLVASVDVISEGFDLPAIGAALLLRPTKSESLYLQQVGRALRAIYADDLDLSTRDGRLAAIEASDKQRAVILDHAGNAFRHGLPEETRAWSLDTSRPKPKTKPAEPGDPDETTRQCPECYHIHDPSPVCPACGHEYEIKERSPEEVDGDLSKITAEQARQFRRFRAREESECQTLDDWMALAEKRGYKKSWAYIRYKRAKPRGRPAAA